MPKTAIILGATGLTGGMLLQQLLEDDRYEKIKLFSRSSVEIENPKIEEHLIDLFKLEEHKDKFTADEVFCCVGTTKSKTPDHETYTRIDRGIPIAAAKLCKENKVDTFLVVSALGANPKSRVFYNRTKGKMEQEVLEQEIKHTYILQPSLITGERKESRSFEKIGKIMLNFVNPFFLGTLRKYKSISAESIAKAMVAIANSPELDVQRIPSDEIKNIAHNN
ncbi:NAD(P)H-binding protein [Salegentibacter mishustinae]|uniref:Nucleoside-diphosphate sugar epimerase n=1 Tax=Salegentibacter mishustinae TaxID=270918 RepID=A0A0Q9ZAI4_9FLAO|nr:NAD(P)H-binding protein [Salegentibacter mishustinae]KRG29957.1 nucleoside-diphosphate sugar epimerase [Salegentibacter mishustinae]PNW20635.1 nucleoside-diphosphate sugar epimerase [Salegentibacter mishustinae]PZX61646.1 putative NAD(P)-binding protein [Salegentibacter mishustinae]GGW98598.1 oxidoreductase [Salegentibacter mishustinae]